MPQGSKTCGKSYGPEAECDRLLCCDEKGFSQRSDAIARGVFARSQARRATAAAPEVTWEHMTVCSFMPCSGPRLPCGVVVSTARVNEVFEKLFPNAVVPANRGGSATTAVFNEFLLRCLALPMRERIPTKPIVCLLG